jgi:hypothetical protein
LIGCRKEIKRQMERERRKDGDWKKVNGKARKKWERTEEDTRIDKMGKEKRERKLRKEKETK